jgi:Mg2+-importing ATPase
MPLDAHYKELLQKRFSDWSGQGFRVLGVASHILPPQEDYTRLDEHDLTFQGFLLFFDPPKEGVIDTIRELESRGVKLKIITGDNKLVTQHLAKLIDLKLEGVLTGSEIDSMPDEALWHSAPKTNLFVEVDPNQKERIIQALQKRGFVVGYMGDGINDAPALYAADVGISVDTAVDVAKEAADLILLKTDLSVLNKGVIYGRNTFANTLKYIFITTSANFGNSFSMAGASLFLPFLPLLPTQILLTNFLTDIPSLNIGTDRVDEEMVAKPTHWNIKYIRNFMLLFGAISSFFDFLTFGTLLLILRANEIQFHTGWFIESVLTELFVLLIMRTRKRFYQSMPSRSLLITTIVIALITISLPFIPLDAVLGFSPLPL